jgi:acetyltransferase-like isoleucine patch superfamily enzyme
MDPGTGTEFQEQITTGRRSALSAYREVTYGQSGFVGFLLFELLTALLSPLPGALGLFLRKIVYRRLVGRLGAGSVVGRNVTIRHPHKIFIGENVVIDDYVVLDAKGGAENVIRIGNGVVLSRSTVLSCKGGSISLGNKTNFAIGCVVHAGGPVTVGESCLLAAGCYLVGVGNHGFERTDIPMMAQPSVSKGLTLADDVWLGAKVVVLDGVTIEQGCVVGACSLVNQSLPSRCIAVGSPARIIRQRG